ncbi:hypothetical protein AMECASPLE_022060 [Ameca splendens]|uniref:Uncharacterized protein n=1 Tax=Ameca splendens TaxID=208324 RepID=A0ABV0YRX3_9TELE
MSAFSIIGWLGTVFNEILNLMITYQISCSDTNIFPRTQNNTTTKQRVWFGNLLMVLKETSVFRRREQAESSCPKSDCLHQMKRQEDPAESTEEEYPISNLKLISPLSKSMVLYFKVLVFISAKTKTSSQSPKL